MVLFGGYIFIWVMLPTDVYNHHWLLKIGADTMSTYFGTQGFLFYLNPSFCLIHVQPFQEL